MRTATRISEGESRTEAGMIELGPRVALLIGIPALALAAVVLIWVHPRRDPRDPDVVVDATAT